MATTNNAADYSPTQYNTQVGGANGTLANVAPSATSGVPLISQGSSSNPVFGTAVVAGGGTGAVTLTSNGVLLGNGTSAITATTAGTTGQVLTGVTGSAPTFQSPAASSITITGDSGGGLTGNSFTFTGGTTGLTFAGAGSTETLGGTLVLANGGTSASLTASNGGIFYSTASAGAILAGTATAKQVLLSGSSTTPAWSTATYPATTTINQLLYSSANNVVGGVTAGDYGVLISSSSGVPSWLANGTTGQVLTATTSGTPSWAAAASGGITTIDGDSGSITGTTVTLSGGSTGLTTTGSSATMDLTGTLIVGNGGTGVATMTTAYAPVCAGTTATGALQVASTGLSTSGYVLTSNGSSALPSFQAATGGGGITWNNVTGTSASMAVNNGYIANNSGLVTLTLPATAAVGSVIEVAGSGAGGWTIAQNSGQTIHFGSVNTTTGTGGSLSSTLQYDCLQMVCNIANTDFVIMGSMGNITYV